MWWFGANEKLHLKSIEKSHKQGRVGGPRYLSGEPGGAGA